MCRNVGSVYPYLFTAQAPHANVPLSFSAQHACPTNSLAFKDVTGSHPVAMDVLAIYFFSHTRRLNLNIASTVPYFERRRAGEQLGLYGGINEKPLS